MACPSYLVFIYHLFAHDSGIMQLPDQQDDSAARMAESGHGLV
jgi:hypothetical protein